MSISKVRMWPIPDAYEEFMDAVNQEPLVHPLWIASESAEGIVNSSDRDKAVLTLRCLKVWYGMPSSFFFCNVRILDHFLRKMIIRQKFLLCITISCFHIAANHFKYKISLENLVKITSARCSTKDVKRMCEIILAKVSIESCIRYTVHDYLALMLAVLESHAKQLHIYKYYKQIVKKDVMLRYLEAVVVDARCAGFKASAIALLVIDLEFRMRMEKGVPNEFCAIQMMAVMNTLAEFIKLCNLSDTDYGTYKQYIWEAITLYDGSNKSPRYKRQSSSRIFAKPSNFHVTLHSIIEE